MSPCVPIEGGTICLTGSTREIINESEGERWCFRCRKRREFRHIVTAEVEPSYYSPNPRIKCGTCGLYDGDLFPGVIREWE